MAHTTEYVSRALTPTQVQLVTVIGCIALLYFFANTPLKSKPDEPEYYTARFVIHSQKGADTVTEELQQAPPVKYGRSVEFGLPISESEQSHPAWEFTQPNKRYARIARGTLISCTGYWDTLWGKKTLY